MSKKDTAFYIKMDSDLRERMQIQSDRHQISQSALVRMALNDLLEKFEKTQKQRNSLEEDS